jgi:hypothetical protein
MTHTYHIECPLGDGWNPFVRGRSKGYCEGYMDAMRGQAPRSHLRMVRSDGKIVDEVPPWDDVMIGQVAGWPSAEHYERAARRAMERAEKIRENQARGMGLTGKDLGRR